MAFAAATAHAYSYTFTYTARTPRAPQQLDLNSSLVTVVVQYTALTAHSYTGDTV